MQKIALKTKVYILIFLLAIAAIFYFYKSPAPEIGSTRTKCPESYTEDDAGTTEYRNALIDWTSEFFETNPKATSSDWSIARSQFRIDNNCTVAIQRYKLSGKVSDLKQWERVDYEVQNAISNAIDTNHYASELGFSFNYPKDMFVMSDPTGPRVLIIPNSYKTDKSKTLTAIVISAMLNNPPMTPLRWLEGPNSGADMSKGYDKVDIDGQEAISMDGGAWIVVNTPDNKRQLSIATLPSVNPSQLLLAEMGIVVNSLVFDK